MPRYKYLPIYAEGSELAKALTSLVQTYRWYLLKDGWKTTACLSDLALLTRIQVRMEFMEEKKSSFMQGDVMQLFKEGEFFYVRFKMGERQGRPIWTKLYPLGRLWKGMRSLLVLDFQGDAAS